MMSFKVMAMDTATDTDTQEITIRMRTGTLSVFSDACWAPSGKMTGRADDFACRV